jgi:hypothetical protein
VAAVWPGTLPTYFSVEAFERQGPDNVVRNTTLSGRVKTRRHSTKTHRTVRGTMMLTQAQVATFETFYLTTLKDGSLPFQGLTNPLTAADTVWLFLADPTQLPFQQSGTHFTLTLELLALPDAPA